MTMTDPTIPTDPVAADPASAPDALPAWLSTDVRPRTVEAVADRLFDTLVAAGEVLAMALGHRLGWYAALAAAADPMTASQLAAATGTHPRYCREWLEHQAVSGMLDVGPGDADAPDHGDARRFSLPAAVAEVMTDVDSVAYLAPLTLQIATAARDYELVDKAARTGGGVSWEAHGVAMRESQAEANRVPFLKLMPDWLASMPDVVARLRTPGARVADVGCGFGWSCVGIARAFDEVTVDGYDVDAASVDAATEVAAREGLETRVRITHADVAALPTGEVGEYTLVTAFECVHDMPDPVGVLAAMREMAGDSGAVMVMDERAAEEFTAPADPVERFLYAASLFVCLPDSMSTPGSVATGTAMRPAVLEGYAREAGFSGLEVLDVDHDFWRFYRLHR